MIPRGMYTHTIIASQMGLLAMGTGTSGLLLFGAIPVLLLLLGVWGVCTTVVAIVCALALATGSRRCRLFTGQRLGGGTRMWII
jgi:hypothetical protein